jgi:signal transduction histidine kinase
LVTCQASQINQVFNHLLSNAIDAMDHNITNPTIRISTSVQAETIEVRISDNGMGIAQTVQEHMFEPFFTTKPVGEGTGLGLYICYRIIVENHNGQLTCHSQKNEGTQFVITLPFQ